jgi:tetratricopeptide (TPR) repeat protein
VPRTFLDVHSTPTEREAPDNNSLVTAALQVAYAALAAGKYDAAERAITPMLDAVMSVRQRLRMDYMRAQIAAAHKQHEAAVDILEDTVDRVENLDAPDAYAELAFLLASQLDRLERWDLGAEAATAALNAWRSRPHLDGPSDPLDVAFEIDIRDSLACELFSLGQLDEAAHQLSMAYSMTPSTPRSVMRGARLQWTLALVERWRGHPQLARQHVQAAFEGYLAERDACELPRLQIVIADIALDLTAAIPAASAFESRDVALGGAGRHLVQAVAETSANGDAYSHGRALLTYARYQRLANANSDRLAIIESVLATANRLNSNVMVANVYAELADELAHSGQRDAALAYYGKALEGYAQGHAPGLNVWAKRGLVRLRGL